MNGNKNAPFGASRKFWLMAAVMTSDEVEDIDQAAKAAIDRAAEEALTFPNRRQRIWKTRYMHYD